VVLIFIVLWLSDLKEEMAGVNFFISNSPFEN
jgi:hypothetical protein